MRPATRGLTVIAVSVLMALCPLTFIGTLSDAAETGNTDFLIDYGNGRTSWLTATAGTTLSDTISSTLTANSISFNAGFTIVDGIGERTIGGADTGGSLSAPGTTGNTVTSGWHVFTWNGTAWAVATDLSAAYSGAEIALGYYPDGIRPASTPVNKPVWTMLQGDSWNSANQTTDINDTASGLVWKHLPRYGGSEPSSLFGGVLSAGGYVFLKYGSPVNKGAPDPEDPSSTIQTNSVECRDLETGDKVWTFEYYTKGNSDTTSAAICGQYIYIGGNNGFIYRIDWTVGPGNNNEYVTTFNGNAWDDYSLRIPVTTVELDWKTSHTVWTETIVADAGSIYFKACNGMIYCFDLDLNLLWADQMDGKNYYNSPTVFDGYVFAGCYDGNLYVYDQNTGTRIAKQYVYQTTDFKGKTGNATTPQVFKDGDSDYTIFVACSDGLGMDSKYSSLVIFKFNGTSMSLVKDFKDAFGATGTYITRYETDTYKGVIVPFNKGLYYIDEEGGYKLLSKDMGGSMSAHNAPLLVNNELLYCTSYSTYNVLCLNLKDNSLTWIQSGATNYAMICPVVIDGLILVSDDNGLQVYHNGTLVKYEPPASVEKHNGFWKTLLIVAIVIVVLLVLTWLILRFGFGFDHPFTDLKLRIMKFFFGEEYTHNTKSKRKVRAVLAVGILITLIVSLISLCAGSETTLSLGQALRSTASAISKGGRNLSYEEMLIYNQRLPRVMAAIAVGIGLSVAGAMYQAVIKNPLVEPYIMGVSSGAGTFAVAVMTTGFTFFGLFSAQSPFLTAFSAIVGGLLAFGLTMLLAVKTGGKSVNFVLAGIVIGLVFSAVQSVLMIGAGTKVASALSWLYGSFSTMTWDKLWLVVVPVLALSFVPLVWAKEFNLVLLGDDQAQQMGLNVKRFNSLMLIAASVLTAFCVAFCGIIGFVGLVIPHLSRMVLGGDHRLMLPASMTLGGFLMVTADLLARVLLQGFELPVGAITTVIGVPVFAYLLVKKGRRYDG